MWAALLASTASSPPPEWQWLTSTVTDGRFCFLGEYFGYCTVHQEDGQLCSSQYVSHIITLHLFCSPCPIIWSVLLYSPLSLVKAEVLLLCYCVIVLLCCAPRAKQTVHRTGDRRLGSRQAESSELERQNKCRRVNPIGILAVGGAESWDNLPGGRRRQGSRWWEVWRWQRSQCGAGDCLIAADGLQVCWLAERGQVRGDEQWKVLTGAIFLGWKSINWLIKKKKGTQRQQDFLKGNLHFNIPSSDNDAVTFPLTPVHCHS